MKIIGLTGGIGSGKSTVTDYLISRGFHVLDADKISREIVSPGSEMLIELVSVFGDDILLEDGCLDRKKLGAIVFSDPEKKKLLDGMMHTKILEIIHEKVVLLREAVDHLGRDGTGANRIAKNKVIFIDAPLLFETGLDQYVGEIWVVDVDEETRINRIIARDGYTREEILKRINTQMARPEKNQRADILLDNSGNREALYRQIELLLQKI